MNSNFEVRSFDSVDDHRQCELVQESVWVGDAAVPTNMTITIQHHGGLALGAFEPDGRMIGFVISMLAPAQQRGARNGLCHHSHIAAVLPALQGKQVGEALKRAQAAALHARGFNLITWTYDPLEARNARLNIAKLGAICRIFVPNCYGDMRDAMNAGLPSDRFEVEWWLDKAAISSCETQMADGQLTIDTRLSTQVVEIPADFQALKRNNFDEARRVRTETRFAFERAFADGLAVTGFTAESSGRAYYTLTKLD
jgi:predicted GNAT superfamily acetyltransferase